jgi:hypothetical protein
MAERTLNRPKKGASLKLSLIIGQIAGYDNQVLILPAVIARHLLDVR